MNGTMGLVTGDTIDMQLRHVVAIMLVGWIKILRINATFKATSDQFIPTRGIEGNISEYSIWGRIWSNIN